MRWAFWLLLLAVACDAPRPLPLTPIPLAESASPATWTVIEPNAQGRERRVDPRTGLTFVRIPAGRFEMGGRSPIDSPRHPVEIGQDFLVAETEVTVDQWRTWLLRDGGWPSLAVPTGAGDLPITGIDHAAASAFAATYGYELPTEAQWEYACRGGASGDGSWLDRARLEDIAWIYTNQGDHQDAHVVRQKAANGFGLYDMLGNVWEWCRDGYAPQHPVTDPTAIRRDPFLPRVGELVVLRGGSWFSVPAPIPSDRMFTEATTTSFLIGFRVVARAP